jgi:hypothetical protein
MNLILTQNLNLLWKQPRSSADQIKQLHAEGWTMRCWWSDPTRLRLQFPWHRFEHVLDLRASALASEDKPSLQFLPLPREL